MHAKYIPFVCIMIGLLSFTSFTNENKIKIAMCQIFCQDGGRGGKILAKALTEKGYKSLNV